MNHYPYLPMFFTLLNQVTENLGLNVSQIIDLNHLSHLAPGTLGRELATFYQHRDLEPFTSGPRRKQLHDSVHVLTGYETDPLGEAEVQAFLLGSYFRPFHFVLGLGLVGMINRRQLYPRSLVRYRLQQAYQQGKQSGFNIDTWQPETQWHMPLSEVQQQFRLFDSIL